MWHFECVCDWSLTFMSKSCSLISWNKTEKKCSCLKSGRLSNFEVYKKMHCCLVIRIYFAQWRLICYIRVFASFFRFSRRQIPEERNPLVDIRLYVSISVKQKSVLGEKVFRSLWSLFLRCFLCFQCGGWSKTGAGNAL